MLNLSYTSNSNESSKNSRLKYALFLTLVFLICFRFVIFISRDLLNSIGTPASSGLINVLNFLSKQSHANPEFLFLGSSRFQSCINTEEFADIMGIKPELALNLSSPSSGIREQKIILTRKLWILNSTKAVFLEMEPWMFNKNTLNPHTGKLWEASYEFRKFASLKDRIDYPQAGERLNLLAQYFWPTYERRSPISWIKGIYNAAFAGEVLKIETPFYHRDKKAAKILEEDPVFSPRNIARDHINKFELDYKAIDELGKIVDLLSGRGTKIVLLQPPVRQEYMDYIFQNEKYKSIYDEILSFIYSLKGDNVHIIIWETPKDCGLDNSVLLDYGHFSGDGAEVFTRRLLEELRKENIL